MNQYIVTAKVEEKVFLSADNEEDAKEKTLDILNDDFGSDVDDVEIVEVKLI